MPRIVSSMSMRLMHIEAKNDPRLVNGSSYHSGQGSAHAQSMIGTAAQFVSLKQ